ncbi:HNH endonuclease [Brevibacillus borstelensis]
MDHYGFDCTVCWFNFNDVYGEIDKELIHVHLLVPLHESGSKYEINPIEDLRPVCPNCHAMLNKRRPPLSIEELKGMLRHK